jgi:2-C-methyl-D-erythritol 4-phosphate cytidylyltransferase
VKTHMVAGALLLASPHPAPEWLWTSVAGRPLLAWSVAACEQTPAIAESVLLVPADRLADAQALAASERWARVRVFPGGPRVRDSVEAGLRALDPALSWIVIHEAARPLVSPTLLAAALDLAQHADADVITGEPVKETVKRLRDGLVVETLPRERMVRAQTPYVFSRERLLAAHATLAAERDFPDEATLALAAGLPLRIFPGETDNLRVTSAADVAVVAALLAARLVL